MLRWQPSQLFTNTLISGLVYKAENELVADFLNDSVKVIVSSWAPSDEQRKVLLDMQTVVRTNRGSL